MLIRTAKPFLGCRPRLCFGRWVRHLGGERRSGHSEHLVAEWRDQLDRPTITLSDLTLLESITYKNGGGEITTQYFAEPISSVVSGSTVSWSVGMSPTLYALYAATYGLPDTSVSPRSCPLTPIWLLRRAA